MKRSGLRSRLAALVTVCITCVCLLSLRSGTAWAKVGRINEFPIPTFTSNSIAITAGPDGNLWFTEFIANQIGEISTK
jgi:streptogramin lyase